MIERSTDIKQALRHRQRGFLLNPFRFNPGVPPGSDPHFANVSLLLHMNGADGSRSFPDNSPRPKSVSVNGDIRVSTAQSKFGGGSGYFDGAGDYLYCPNDDEFFFGSGDFTVEGWIYPTALGAVNRCIVGYTNGYAEANQYSFNMYLKNASLEFDFVSGASVYTANVGSVVANEWSYVAVSRVGATIRAFLNGVVGANVASVGALSPNNPFGAVINIGQLQNVIPFVGYMNDMRITKGVGRYSSSFTPPTAPFPNS